MIAGIFHSGSGLGNQLHRYVATRVLALDKGYEFSMVAPELFKGKGFMNLDMGKEIDTNGIKGPKFPFRYDIEQPSGKVVPWLNWHGGEPTALWEEKTPYY